MVPNYCFSFFIELKYYDKQRNIENDIRRYQSLINFLETFNSLQDNALIGYLLSSMFVNHHNHAF